MGRLKKKHVKVLANNWSYRITLVGLVLFILWNFVVADYSNTTWIYYLIPVLVASFILAVIGIPLDKKNDKKLVIQSTITLILSAIMISLLGYIYISPVLFPFGIPPR